MFWYFWFIFGNRGIAAMCSPFMNNQTSSLSFSLHQCLQDEFFHCVCLYLLAYFHLFLDKLMLNWLFDKLGRCFYAIFFLFFLLNCLSLTSLLYINLLDLGRLYFWRQFLLLRRIFVWLYAFLQVNSKWFMTFSWCCFSWNVGLYPFFSCHLLRNGYEIYS